MKRIIIVNKDLQGANKKISFRINGLIKYSKVVKLSIVRYSLLIEGEWAAKKGMA